MSAPLFKSLRAYRNDLYGYSLPRPDEWHELPLEVEGGQGVLWAPSVEDLATSLSVEVRDVGAHLGGDDLPTLRVGFLKGLRTVPRSRIERQDAYDHGFVIGLEAVQRYDEDGARRKRWVRLLYKGSIQARLVARAASPLEFDRWYPAFAPAMTSFVFGDVWPAPRPATARPPAT